MTKDRAKALMGAVRDLTTRQVMVGVPSTTAGRDDGPVTNAVLGYIHEFGSPAANIPARPFLVPGVRNAEPKTAAHLKAGARAALDGNSDAVDAALNSAGLVAQAAVQKKITDGPFAPLAERTLAARRARGVTRTKPLIDTGALRQAIRYVLRRKGK